MKRLICILLVLSLLLGCEQRVIAQLPETREPPTALAPTPQPTDTPAPPTPGPTATPRPVLATFAPQGDQEALFPEELLSQEGEPVCSLVRSLLSETLSKAEFYDRFLALIRQVDGLDAGLLALSDRGCTLTADRRDKTAEALTVLMGDETLSALQAAYDACPGEGAALPLSDYAASVDALVRDVTGMGPRTVPFFSLDDSAARDYRTALSRYMGEPVVPLTALQALEDLVQTEAYAIATALQADPEAARKKEPISFGSYGANMAFLCRITRELCPLPDGSDLPVPAETELSRDMSLLELAFRYYPGMALLTTYAARETDAQRARWASASQGYLAGLAVHGSYVIVPYLSEFGLEYVQYRWYEEMLSVTLTGVSALLIHYYGYSKADLQAYLKGWGAEDFADYLYGKAMSDPFDSLVASYGYIRYLSICQAALDAGCETEQRFLQDYLKAGPAPYEALKEYMVRLYQNERLTNPEAGSTIYATYGL